MQTVTATEILRKPSLLNTKEILILEDGRKHIPKSVIIPFDMYQKVKEKIEIEDRIEKLKRIRDVKDSNDWLELGVDDGIE